MIMETHVAYPKTMLAVTLRTMFGVLSSWIFLENERTDKTSQMQMQGIKRNSLILERKLFLLWNNTSKQKKISVHVYKNVIYSE